jgi:hypothetical protein
MRGSDCHRSSKIQFAGQGGVRYAMFLLTGRASPSTVGLRGDEDVPALPGRRRTEYCIRLF